MAAFREISNLVDQALQNRQDLWIRYRTMQGSFSNEVVTPFEWIDEDKTLFHAYSQLDGEERLFNVFTVVEARAQENPIETAPRESGPQPDSAGVQAAPVLARPISRFGSADEEEDSPPSQPVLPPLNRVETPADWRRLMSYYYACLHQEQQAQMVFEKKSLFLIALERQQIYEFLQGKIDLQFTLTFRHFLHSFRNFINSEQHPGETLCLGASFFCLDETRISPLLFTTVGLEFLLENQVQLKAGHYNVNIAPLIELGLNQDEIAAFQQEACQFLQTHDQISEIENYLLAKYSAFFALPIKLFPATTYAMEDVPAISVFDGAGLFWLKPAQAKSTVDELADLLQEKHWNSAPDTLLNILNLNQPALAPPPEEDLPVFSTLSKEQRDAVNWASRRPLTVISGAPGSGKTQVLYNILLRAFLEGKTVLFTSPSQAVVDALANQVIDGLEFPGALRSGSFEQRMQLTRRIDQILSRIHKEDAKEFQQNFSVSNQMLNQAENRLNIIQDLRGKEISYESELKELQRFLPDVIVKKVFSLGLAYAEHEKQLWLEALSRLSDQVRELVNMRVMLQNQLVSAIAASEHQASTNVFHEFEDRWGQFGSGELSFERITRLEELIRLIQLWLDLLSALEARRDHDRALARLRDIEQKTDRSLQKLTAEQRQRAEYFARYFSANSQRKNMLVNAHKALGILKTELETKIAAPQRWSNKITDRLKILNPYSGTAQRLAAVLIQLDWTEAAAALNGSPPARQLDLCSNVIAILRSAILLQKTTQSREQFEAAQAASAALIDPLPQAIRKDINKLALASYNKQPLHQVLVNINQTAFTALQLRKDSAEKISQLISGNSLQLKWIQEMQVAFTGAERAFFKINEDAAESQLEQYLRIWRRITWLWELHGIIANMVEQKKALPGEAKALFTYQSATSQFHTALHDYLYASWMDRAADLDTITIQGVARYSMAVQQEAEGGDEIPSAGLQQLREIQRANFPHLLRLFPVWFASPATVAENFPLTSELFDLVIIDHASFETIPAAVTLLYRAKNVVIAGDPRQRQLSTLLNPLFNQQILSHHAINPEPYSYQHSLFDLVISSAHQPAFKLSEHFRSDPRIATFISQEFYDRPLRILTNLVKQGYQRETVNHTGGIFWVNIKGAFQRSAGGSAFNLTEQELIQELLLRLVERAQQNDRPSPSIAVISPFRAQAQRLQEWIDGAIPADQAIRAGTPQDFQGEETDLVIFSPVIASGMPKEALDGVETTSHLLNLGLSRARIGVIIVGDWQYCSNQLPANHSYHHLARYCREKCVSLVEALSSLALIGGPVSCAKGYFPDPSDTEHSRTTLEQLLLSCRDTIFWIDPQFDQQVIDLFDEIVDRVKSLPVKDLRLITSERLVNPPAGKPILRPEMLQTFTQYLANLGYRFECRTLTGEASNRGILSDSTGSFLLPPFPAVFRRHRLTSEYSIARASIEELQLLWEKANPVAPRVIS